MEPFEDLFELLRRQLSRRGGRTGGAERDGGAERLTDHPAEDPFTAHRHGDDRLFQVASAVFRRGEKGQKIFRGLRHDSDLQDVRTQFLHVFEPVEKFFLRRRLFEVVVGDDDRDPVLMGRPDESADRVRAKEQFHIDEVDEAGHEDGFVEFLIGLWGDALLPALPPGAEGEQERCIAQLIAKLGQKRQDREQTERGHIVEVVHSPLDKVSRERFDGARLFQDRFPVRSDDGHTDLRHAGADLHISDGDSIHNVSISPKRSVLSYKFTIAQPMVECYNVQEIKYSWRCPMAEIRRPDDMVRITTPELADAFIEEQIALVKEQVGDKKVLLALSGGVDSSVVAALLIKAIGDQLVCVHVNHGLLRKGEPEQVIQVFRNEMNANLIYVDAVDRFLDLLAGVTDPEQKRHIIGKEFIKVFAEEARKLDGIEFLAQGTIWPDILESEAGIKAHHNAGGLPEDLNFELVEPVRILFKDEVRVVGEQLGLPAGMVYRQPFPGPGLGVRCPGAITRDRLEAVRESDAILREEFAKNGLEGKVWQYFTVVPDFKSTGVTNGKRSFEWPCIIRAINTTDVVECSVEHLDPALIDHLAQRITTEVEGINRVLYDFTPKPPATVEYE